MSFRDVQANRFVVKFDPETNRLGFGDTRRADLPPHDFSVLIGEVVYNLRAALDYLVYELALLDAGTPKGGTQFPIEDTPEGFKGRRTTFLKGVNDEHVAAIERLQPSAGCDWTKLLASLSNPDKHRHLIATASLNEARYSVRAVTPGTPPELPTTRVYSAEGREGPIDVHVDLDVSVEIAFDDETSVVDALELLESQVAQVLDLFKPEFEGLPAAHG